MFLSPITHLQRHVELVQTIDALCFIICFTWVIIIFELFTKYGTSDFTTWLTFSHYSLNNCRIVMNFFPLFGGS
jgi:hypothetical protein